MATLEAPLRCNLSQHHRVRRMLWLCSALNCLKASLVFLNWPLTFQLLYTLSSSAHRGCSF